MVDKTPEEIAYIKGFYAASKGVLYCLEDKDSTVESVRDAILYTLDEMKQNGDLDGLDSQVDELIDLVKQAEAMGREDELFALLDKHFGGN